MLSLIDDLPSCSTILEPSGGDGAFVAALLGEGLPPSSITVWDVNPKVAEPLEDMGVHVAITDALLNADPSTFDLVLGNPPYLNKASEYLRATKKDLARPYEQVGVNDTYALFTFMAVNRLNPGGQLVFLISDTFLTLGIHRKLREFLLASTRIDSITLLPRDTFEDASVNTAILKLTKTTPSPSHEVRFTDASAQAAPCVSGPQFAILQSDLADHPSSVFAFTPQDRSALALASAHPPLMDFLDGGLGMFTTDNRQFLLPLTGPRSVDADSVDYSQYRPYHKKGGAQQWFAPLDHVVLWTDQSRRVFGIPASALAGVDAHGRPRRGLLLSGVSTRLAARTLVRGAMWESNKVFALFPKDPDRYPVEFFLAVLNSDTYNAVASALNHTLSLQVRDLQRLPMLAFTDAEVRELADLGLSAAAFVRDGGHGTPAEMARINAIVEAAASR